MELSPPTCVHIKLSNKGNTSTLTGQPCFSPRQPQGARRRSYFGVNVARFVGRRCGGGTTQGVTPHLPPLSLDLLSGTPCMEQGIVFCRFVAWCEHVTRWRPLPAPHQHQFASSAVHAGTVQDSTYHWMGVSTLHVMSFVLPFSRLHFFMLLSCHLIF